MRLLLTLLVVLAPVSAYAQTHPCDTTPPPADNVTVGQSYLIGWCQPALDDGVVFREYRDGVLVGTLVPVSGTVSASGLREYHVSKQAETASGSVVIELTAVNTKGEESAKSAPFTLTVVPRVPVAPTGLRRIR